MANLLWGLSPPSFDGDWDRQIPNWEGWHYFGVLWNKDGYTFYVDGKEDGRLSRVAPQVV